MKLGAHLSIAGGHSNALKKIVDIGGNCLQIFSASPRGWNFITLTEEQINHFKHTRHDLNLNPIYFHASYLINLANTAQIAQLSKNLLIHELKVASEMGIKGSIIHLGSYKDTDKDFIFSHNDSIYSLFIKNVKEILDKTPSNTLFIIENAGNRKIGLKLEEIGEIIHDISDLRLKVCLDTCHLHAAGYDLSSKEKLDLFLKKFDNLIGLNRLEVIHLNDSKDSLGSLRDRHENIGKGYVGIEVFELLLNDQRIKHIPMIIEVPGYDNNGPDKENLDFIKTLIQ